MDNMLIKTKKGLLINEDDINTLKKYNIDVNKYSKITEVLYQIDNIINDLDDEDYEELDYIASNLQERMYYKDYNK